MHSLKHYWKRLFSRAGESEAPAPEQLEREIQTVSSESHALAEDVQRFRSDFEHTREEEERKIASLEQVRTAMEQAREQDHRKLTEFESINQTLQTARDSDSKKIQELERRLAELEAERARTKEQARALEDSLAETTSRLEKTDGQVRQLQASTVEQAQHLSASLQETGSRVDSTDDHIRELEGRLDSERKDYLSILQQMQGTMRKQDSRMGWTMAAAGFALLLGATAGAILIWDVQKNAGMLSRMSTDIRELMTSVNDHMSRQHSRQDDVRQQAMPAPDVVPESRETVAAAPKAEAVAKPESTAPSTGATISKPASNPYFLSSALERGRAKQTEGLRQMTRSDADVFFEKNAKLEGVISLPSGVQYRIVTPGSGRSPLPADKVVVKYVGTTLDGAIFDETYTADEPGIYSMNELQPGWREVLLKMEEGTEFELYIPAKFTTGGGVRKRGVLGYEPNIYLIELVQVLRDGMPTSSE